MPKAAAKKDTDNSLFVARGFLSDLLPWAFAPEDGVCLTKDAVLLRTAVVVPDDLSFREDAIETRLKAINMAFRLIADTGWSLYVTAHRSPDESVEFEPAYDKEAPEITKALEERRALLSPFYTTRIYVTVGRSLKDEINSLRNFKFNAADRENTAHDTIRYHLAQFVSATDDFFGQLRFGYADLQIASSDEQLSIFHGALSGDYHPIVTPSPAAYLDYYLADGTVNIEPSLKYNDEYILTNAVHAFPHETNIRLLSNLLSLDETFDLVTRFVFASEDAAKKEIKSAREQHFKKRKGMKSMAQDAMSGGDSDGLTDTDAEAMTADAGEALARMVTAGVSYGHMTVTTVVRHRSFSEAARVSDRLVKLTNSEGYVVKPESLNNREAFFGTLPGNIGNNARKPILSTNNLAHFFVLSAPWTGEKINKHLSAVTGFEAPQILAKSGHAPFYLNLNVGDVGHTLVVGPTGAGKSTFLNFLSAFWLKAPTSRVVFFDKDRSAYYPTLNAGGTHIELDDESNALKLNPFAHLQSKQDQAFVSQIVADYLRMRGIPVLPKDQQALFEAAASLSSVASRNAAWETYRSAVQDQNIRDALTPFIDGEYANLFTREDDPLSQERWLTFEMGKLMNRDTYIVQFILSYLFHRVETTFFTGQPVLLILDEAWFFLDNEIFASKMREWLKVLRKKNVYVVLATQEMEDARQSTIFSTIVNACFTKILLPNPNAYQSDNHAIYRDIGLEEPHIYAIANAQQKREYLYHSELGSQLFNFHFHPDELEMLKGKVTVLSPNEETTL